MALKKSNSRKNRFLDNLPQVEIISDIMEVKGKLSFSFQYFDGSQEAGQDFKDWTNEQKDKLLEKLKEYSKESKVYWLNQRTGSGGLKVLAIYENFPRNSDFVKPAFVLENVKWSRFRMENMVRLVGFFVSEEDVKEKNLSSDIFYVVFLDKDHRFYKTEAK